MLERRGAWAAPGATNLSGLPSATSPRTCTRSFAPNPDWTRTFSPQPEIWQYLRASGRRSGTEATRPLSATRSTAARWDERQRSLADGDNAGRS